MVHELLGVNNLINFIVANFIFSDLKFITSLCKGTLSISILLKKLNVLRKVNIFEQRMMTLSGPKGR
jgi:hypothetical protein